MKMGTYFTTEDGEIFLSVTDAEKHEAELAEQKKRQEEFEHRKKEIDEAKQAIEAAFAHYSELKEQLFRDFRAELAGEDSDDDDKYGEFVAALFDL